jgi:hypothetical protein
MGLIKDLALTALFFVLLYFVIPPVVHTRTGNSWMKLPVMVGLAIIVAIAMAYVGYVPWLLALLLLPVQYHDLKAMETPAFRQQHVGVFGSPPNMLLYRTATYLYAVVACGLAVLLQVEVVDSRGARPLWRDVVGLN